MKDKNLSIVTYDVDYKKVTEITTGLTITKIESNKDREIVQKTKTQLVKLRTAIKDRKKELKADALEFANYVESEYKRVMKIVEDAEYPITLMIEEYDNEQKRIKEEKERKEEERKREIFNAINAIISFPQNQIGKSSDDMKSAFELISNRTLEPLKYQEYLTDALAAKEKSIKALELMIEERINYEKEQELEKQRKIEQEKERVRIEAERAELEKAQAEFKRKQEELAEKERARLQEENRLKHQEELKRLEEENRKQAEIQRKELEIEKEKNRLLQQQKEFEKRIQDEKIRKQNKITSHAVDMLDVLKKIYEISNGDHDSDNIFNKIKQIENLSSLIIKKIEE